MKHVPMIRVTLTFANGLAPRVSYHDEVEEAERAAAYWPNSSATIERCDAGVFEPGDAIEVELHRGGHYDENSIMRGGKWLAARGIVRSVYGEGVFASASVWNDDGSHLQEMSAITGVSAYPYRNARLAAL